jgi:hypothetical protein
MNPGPTHNFNSMLKKELKLGAEVLLGIQGFTLSELCTTFEVYVPKMLFIVFVLLIMTELHLNY